MSYHGRFENQPNQKRRRKNSSAGKIMLIVLVVVLLLILGAVAWAMVYYYQMMNKMNTITLPPVTTAATEHQIQPTQASETISVTEATTLPTETTRSLHACRRHREYFGGWPSSPGRGGVPDGRQLHCGVPQHLHRGSDVVLCAAGYPGAAPGLPGQPGPEAHLRTNQIHFLLCPRLCLGR